MKKITQSAEDHLAEQAAQPASRTRLAEYRALMDEIRRLGARAGRTFTREEMNER